MNSIFDTMEGKVHLYYIVALDCVIPQTFADIATAAVQSPGSPERPE